MNDERFDALLQRLAREYNAPPPTPREEIWAGIAAARRTPRGTPGPARTAVWLRRLGGLAAVLVLGIAIGWFAARDGGRSGAGSVPAPVAERSLDTGGERTEPDPRLAAAPAGGDEQDAGRREAPAGAGDAPRTIEVRDGPRLAPAIPARLRRSGAMQARATAPAGRSGTDRHPGARDDEPAGGIYSLLATQTLAQGEALLTAFRAAEGSHDSDPQVGAWAREILSSTRLLLDSPSADDSLLRGLLEDLELVLLQIVHLSGGPADSAELAWIRETLRQRDMLPRLRTAVPAGPVAAGT